MSARFGLTVMHPRDPSQPHRPASALELFFDLVFVVAVSAAATQLHHSESADHLWAGLGGYLMLFFAVWWAWMNFTWFATSFDTDDWLYRVLTIMQMAGVLVLAAGASAAMNDGDYTLITLGYAIMRLALVPQWLRAAKNPEIRTTALRFAIGITVLQTLWIIRLWLPEQGGIVVFLVLAAGEIAVPALAERGSPTPWHPDHIAERYGLFTLILLGESLLAAATAIIDAIEHADHIAPLIGVATSGLILAACMWWIYFIREHGEHIEGLKSALRFGYGHYIIFAAAGAFSAGIEVAIDYTTDSTGLARGAAAATLTVPVALFILSTWGLTLRPYLTRAANFGICALGIVAGLAALLPYSIPVATACAVAIVVILEVDRARGDSGSVSQATAGTATTPPTIR